MNKKTGCFSPEVYTVRTKKNNFTPKTTGILSKSKSKNPDPDNNVNSEVSL